MSVFQLVQFKNAVKDRKLSVEPAASPQRVHSNPSLDKISAPFVVLIAAVEVRLKLGGCGANFPLLSRLYLQAKVFETWNFAETFCDAFSKKLAKEVILFTSVGMLVEGIGERS